MSKRNKLQKFAEMLSFPNVYETFDYNDLSLKGKDGESVNLKGKWQAEHFKNDNPITLELACGRGEYTLALARAYPDRNFIGVDIKGARIWKGARTALAEGLDNAAFLRTRIEMIDRFIAENEVSEIWITFPDPFLKKGKSNRRLTAPNFLRLYEKMLKSDGLIHLKTDSPELYEFTLEVLENKENGTLVYHNENIYSGELPMPELIYKTYYEKMHLAINRTIKYVRLTPFPQKD